MHSIVAPVNFTPNSDHAARYAADLALAAHADLYLFHVLARPLGAEVGARSLGRLWRELTERTGAKVNIHVRMDMGFVGSKIERFCREKSPFVIVMGQSKGDLEEELRQLSIPLIAVPHAAFRTLSIGQPRELYVS